MSFEFDIESNSNKENEPPRKKLFVDRSSSNSSNSSSIDDSFMTDASMTVDCENDISLEWLLDKSVEDCYRKIAEERKLLNETMYEISNITFCAVGISIAREFTPAVRLSTMVLGAENIAFTSNDWTSFLNALKHLYSENSFNSRVQKEYVLKCVKDEYEISSTTIGDEKVLRVCWNGKHVIHLSTFMVNKILNLEEILSSRLRLCENMYLCKEYYDVLCRVFCRYIQNCEEFEFDAGNEESVKFVKNTLKLELIRSILFSDISKYCIEEIPYVNPQRIFEDLKNINEFVTNMK